MTDYIQSAHIKVGIVKTCLKIGEIRFFVKAGLLEAETMGNIVDSLRTIFRAFVLLLCRGVRTWMSIGWVYRDLF